LNLQAKTTKIIYYEKMTTINENAAPAPQGQGHKYTRETAATGVEKVIKLLDGRWKLLILFQLFGGRVLRFSDLERAIPAVSQKMLIQQLRQLENDGIVKRLVYPEVPPRVEYSLTEWGQDLCPVLDALLNWAALREQQSAD